MLTENTPEFTMQAAQMKRSAPGEAMSNNPDSPYPFESAPEFTVQREALEYLFTVITDESKYVDILIAIDNGVPIMELTQVILFKGFTEGKWNPDLMMMLAEPTTYMLMALAERADIDFKVYKGEEEDEDAEATLFNIDIDKQKLKELRSVSKSQEIPKGMIPKEIEEQIEELPASSLLSKPEEEEPEDSLLGRTST